MSDWQQGTIGELAKGYRGVTYSAGQLREFKTNDTVTLLRSNNISGGQLNFRDVQIVSESLVGEDQLLTPGDIAVCMSNGSKALVGKSAQLLDNSDERFTAGAFCSVFRPLPTVNSRFVAYAFQSSSYRNNLDLALAGTAINNLRNVDIEGFACGIPPLEEQGQIAKILDTLDTAIRETEAIIAKLKAVKQGLLHDLLTRGIDANGELRPLQSEAPQLYKESPLGWIPREWDVQSLENITATPICYGIVQVFDYVPSGVPVLAIRDLLGDYVTGIHRTAPNIDAAYPRSRVKPGDVLLSIKGTIGRVGVVPTHYFGNISRDIALIRPTSAIRSGYLAQLLRSPIGQAIITQAQVGTTRAEISIAPLRKLEIAFPDLSEQVRIEEALESADIRLADEQAKLDKLQSKKIGLMDDLLTGRVRVTPLLEGAATP